MKLACKRFSDAWKSGDPKLISESLTPEFSQVMGRVPAELLAKMPKSGEASVTGSRKLTGKGTVSIECDTGAMTLVLVGKGFEWKVDDIYRKTAEGRSESLKTYLDNALTVREFLTRLKHGRPGEFHSALSSRFLSQFVQLSWPETARVAAMLPEVNGDIEPVLRLYSNHATLQVAPNASNPSEVVFTMVKETSWRIDDFSISGPTIRIPSFRAALPLLASVCAFREYSLAPGRVDPATFTVPGALRQALEQARSKGGMPVDPQSPNLCFGVSACGRWAEIRTADRLVRVRASDQPETAGRIEALELAMGKDWLDVASLLAMKQKAESLSGGGIGGLFQKMVAGDGSTSSPAATPRTDVPSTRMRTTIPPFGIATMAQ